MPASSYLALAGASFAGAVVLTWVMLRVVRVMDVPNERSSHARPVPKSGGIAIVATFVAGSLVLYYADAARIEARHFCSLLVAGVALAAVSFVDDVLQHIFLAKIGVQVLCVCGLLVSGVVLDELGYVLTFLWILGLTNAYNFMDGLDGLAGGVGVIAAGFLCAIALSRQSEFVALSSTLLLAGTAGFLVFNLPPAKIFMGDVGAAFLGFAFAAIAVIGAADVPFYVVPLLLFHFIFDTLLTFFRRLARGERVHEAHRSHLYQLLNRTGWSHGAVSGLHCAMTLAQGVGALVLLELPGAQRPLVFAPFLLAEAAYAAWVLKRARRAGIL